MSGDISIPLPRELVLEACAKAAQAALVESGFLEDLAQARAVLSDLRYFKEGLLTAEQAAAMLQVSLRTFKRQVAKGLWPEIRIMGSQEYRYPVQDMRALMDRRRKNAAGESPRPAQQAA